MSLSRAFELPPSKFEGCGLQSSKFFNLSLFMGTSESLHLCVLLQFLSLYVRHTRPGCRLFRCFSAKTESANGRSARLAQNGRTQSSSSPDAERPLPHSGTSTQKPSWESCEKRPRPRALHVYGRDLKKRMTGSQNV